MTTIILPPDLEADLHEQASREGKSVEAIAIDRLRKFVATQPSSSPTSRTVTLGDLVGQTADSEPKSRPRNLLEFLGEYVGCVEGTGEPLSENCGERFTEHLVEKQRSGTL